MLLFMDGWQLDPYLSYFHLFPRFVYQATFECHPEAAVFVQNPVCLKQAPCFDSNHG